MSNYHCATCKRDAKKNYRAVEFTPYGLDTWYYNNETVLDVVDEDGTTVPMRTDEFNGRVGDA